MVSRDPLWVGLEVIRESELSRGAKAEYSRGWEIWVADCGGLGVGPLSATVDDALRWLEACERTPREVGIARRGVSFVFKSLGMVSPLKGKRIVLALNGEGGGVVGSEKLSDSVARTHRGRVLDYLVWCERNGRAALPGSGAQVAEFLAWLSEEYCDTSIRQASSAVSKYLEANGCPPTSLHPAVSDAVSEGVSRFMSRGGPGSKEPTPGQAEVRERYRREWRQWCEREGIQWENAGVDDVLRYLRGLEHHKKSWTRVVVLSGMYPWPEDPFSDEAVLEWKARQMQAATAGVITDGRLKVSADEVLGRIRSARTERWEEVPVGMTREELDELEDDVMSGYGEKTAKAYIRIWTRFEVWLESRGTSLERAVGWHVAGFLKDNSYGNRVSYLWRMAGALAVMFDELCIEDNPARSDVVERYLNKLESRRREAPAQKDPIRESDYQKVVAAAGTAVSGGKSRRREVRAAAVVAVFSLMFDGMLRAKEASQARWRDLRRFPDGSARLLLPQSKTDRFGEGQFVYVSPRSLRALDAMRDVRRRLALDKAGDDRLFQVGSEQLGEWVKQACREAGLEGDFGTHSFRIGMAQELAVAGFGLVLIMQAGRWTTPEMPAYYIRGLKASESAVAELHRMMADGRFRAEEDAKGYDVLSTYYAVRFGN